MFIILNLDCRNNLVSLVPPGFFNCDDGTVQIFVEFFDPLTNQPFPLNDVSYFNVDAGKK
jgi:hypothetical protein